MSKFVKFIPRATLTGVALLVCLLGWLLWRQTVPVTPTPARLIRTGFDHIPSFTEPNAAKALSAFRASCGKILARPHGPMGGVYAGNVDDWRVVCRTARNTPAKDARRFFRNAFVPFQLVPPAGTSGLFTGYYAPEIELRAKADAHYSAPVYGVPSDLVRADLGAFRADLQGVHIAGRVVAGRFVPYPDRAAIAAGGLQSAPVLAWADPVDLFFLQIQGSGIARFADGRRMRIQYAAQNGRPYTAIGRVLIKSGAIPREKMSMQAIRHWLHTHPRKAVAAMRTNASYVFFTMKPLTEPAAGPVGAEGVPLTAGASVAVDTRVHGFGVPLLIATEDVHKRPLERLCIAQDKGGAIRGAVRADIYFGAGHQAAEMAGAMQSPGKMYVLLPQSVAERMPDSRVLPPAAGSCPPAVGCCPPAAGSCRL